MSEPIDALAGLQLSPGEQEYVRLLVVSLWGGPRNWAEARPDLRASEWTNPDAGWAGTITAERKSYLVDMLKEASDGDFSLEASAVTGCDEDFVQALYSKVLGS
jgi:hypothetical protein